MKQNQFSRKANHIAQQKLASILAYEISDPALELVSITGVEVSVDKSVMIVYVSCSEETYDEVLSAFARARGRIRRLLGKALSWRVTPELIFRIDNTIDEAEAIARALTHVPETMAQEKDEFGYPIERESSSSDSFASLSEDESESCINNDAHQEKDDDLS